MRVIRQPSRKMSRDDLITVADAATCYGVVIDPATRRVDDAATARLREKVHRKARQ